MPKDVTQNSFWKHMTDEQRSIIAETTSVAEQEYLYCDAQYQRAKCAQIRLPHTNERGEPVVHGANMQVHYFEQYWHRRRDATKDMLSSEFVKEHNVNTFVRYC
jgi:hypothetical protein